jgi:hypothetical protein
MKSQEHEMSKQLSHSETAPASRAAAPTPKQEPVKVTDWPLAEAGNGVYKVIVKIDDQQPGSSVVRTIQRKFAFQTE